MAERVDRWMKVAAGAVALVLIAGCRAPAGVKWEPNAEPSSLEQVERRASEADTSGASDTKAEDAPDVRNQVLVWLRKQGPDGGRAASLLTEGFPTRVEAVPLLVQIASVDGTRSLVVVEAIPGKSGRLDARRLWVFDMDSGKLIRSSSYR